VCLFKPPKVQVKQLANCTLDCVVFSGVYGSTLVCNGHCMVLSWASMSQLLVAVAQRTKWQTYVGHGQGPMQARPTPCTYQTQVRTWVGRCSLGLVVMVSVTYKNGSVGVVTVAWRTRSLHIPDRSVGWFKPRKVQVKQLTNCTAPWTVSVYSGPGRHGFAHNRS